ncbi:MAG: D-alanyl-D-alanine carboxypeptidase [Firmicutes bacterium]|nr:D-alanyl-D-alanine carboxypeptidase [Bacillota bacterium]
MNNISKRKNRLWQVALIAAVLVLAVGFFAKIYFKNSTLANAHFDNYSNLSTAADAKTIAANEKYNAKSVVLVDYFSGQTLFSQNPDTKLPIASMVKIMTLNIIFDDLASGTFALSDQIPISQNAASMGGSQAFLDAGSTYSADELIKSIIVASANDACVAMAEHLSGSVESFVSRMNEKAQALSLTNTVFANTTGLPVENAAAYSTAADVATMFRQLAAHKVFYDYANVWLYDLVHPGGRATTLTNTNKLVRFYNGCDGGKTGFTSEALSCLAATAKRGDTRLIAVVVGSPEAKIRNAETSRLFNHGFANFETKKIVGDDFVVENRAIVDKGRESSVGLKVDGEFYKLVKKGEKVDHELNIIVDSVKAPVLTGDVVGKIEIKSGGEIIGVVNLVASEDVKKASYLDIVNKFVDNWNK